MPSFPPPAISHSSTIFRGPPSHTLRKNPRCLFNICASLLPARFPASTDERKRQTMRSREKKKREVGSDALSPLSRCARTHVVGGLPTRVSGRKLIDPPPLLSSQVTRPPDLRAAKPPKHKRGKQHEEALEERSRRNGRTPLSSRAPSTRRRPALGRSHY